jgi:hypothetical protein
VLAFATDRSERLGMMASYPLLLGNAIFWLSQDDEASRQGNNMRTGHVVETGGENLVWESSDGTALQSVGGRAVVELDRLGLWRIGEKAGSAALLSKQESLRPANRSEDLASAGAADEGGLRGDLRPLFLWLVLILLALEAWLFHRHSVY